MNQQSLATVILRILGLSYVYNAITALFSGNVLMQVMSVNEAYGEEHISLMVIIGGIVGMQSLFGIILMVFAGSVSKVLFKKDEGISGNGTLTANALIQAAVPIVGLYFAVSYFPRFIIVAIGWFQVQAGPPSGMPFQSGAEMAHYTIMMVLSIFITLRSKSISRILIRNAK
jgi:hypothetical protein